jgi:riboflavin kinase/FMN adenylyltransferase
VTVLTWRDLLDRRQPLDRPVRLTIGVFDGLHVGHRKLMSAITGGPPEVLPLVLTFRRSPALSMDPGGFPGCILSFDQKLCRMDALGVGAVVAIDFSDELSTLSGKAFVGILRENLTIQRIVAGENFRFGKSRTAGTDDLKEMLSDTGTEVLVSEPVLWHGSAVSSSRVRSAIRRGDLADARDMLAAEYCLDLRGVPSRSMPGGSLRIRRADLRQVIPAAGEYAVRCQGAGGPRAGACVVTDSDLTLHAADCDNLSTATFV